jgi:bifunctional DNA-binding transcriptional regulator/antitoxin component of YhaV-PrlF toxin-antitoxin module
MARRDKASNYRYTRTATVRGREADGRYAVVQLDHEHSRVVRRLPDGTAPGDGVLVPTVDVLDVRTTIIVSLGQRGTLTLPDVFRRDLGLEDGRPLEIMQEADGRISIRPLPRLSSSSPRFELEDLLEGVSTENIHGEVSTGGPQGAETW